MPTWPLIVLAGIATYFGLASALGRHLGHRPGATPLPETCQHCGWPLPSDRIAYCTRACRWADEDHGPNGDDQ